MTTYVRAGDPDCSRDCAALLPIKMTPTTDTAFSSSADSFDSQLSHKKLTAVSTLRQTQDLSSSSPE